MLQQEIFSSQWCYTHFLSFFHIVPLSLFSRLPFHLPLPPHPPFYSDIFCSYLYYYLITSQILRDITLLVSSPPLSWNSDFWGMFVLFRLSHMHSMQQSLGYQVRTPSLMRRQKSSTFLRVLEVSRDSKHLLESIRGSFVYHFSDKTSFLLSPWEQPSCVTLFFHSTQEGLASFFSQPIVPQAFFLSYRLGPICSPRRCYFLDLKGLDGDFFTPHTTYKLIYT